MDSMIAEYLNKITNTKYSRQNKQRTAYFHFRETDIRLEIRCTKKKAKWLEIITGFYQSKKNLSGEKCMFPLRVMLLWEQDDIN